MDWMRGCPDVRKCRVACLFLDWSQQPTWPQLRHARRWTHVSPKATHSSQTSDLGSTGIRDERWVQGIRRGAKGARRRARGKRREANCARRRARADGEGEGRWLTANCGLTLGTDNCGVAHGNWCQLPTAKCQLSTAKCQVPSAKCQVPSAKCQVPSANFQMCESRNNRGQPVNRVIIFEITIPRLESG
jgi:hypothetical protein